MVRIVESGPDEVIHRRIHNDEVFRAGSFHIFDAGDEDAGVADDETSRLDQDFQVERVEQRNQACGINGGSKNVLAPWLLPQFKGEPLARAGS